MSLHRLETPGYGTATADALMDACKTICRGRRLEYSAGTYDSGRPALSPKYRIFTHTYGLRNTPHFTVRVSALTGRDHQNISSISI